MKTRHLLFAAKLALSIGLVWYVAQKFHIAEAFEQLEHLTIGWMAALIALFYIQLGVAALRLREFLGVYEVHVGRRWCAVTTLISYFFSQTFISFVGGDAMRVLRATQAGIGLHTAAKAVTLDRASGFASMMVFIILVLPFALPRMADPAMRLSLLLLVAAAVGGGVAVLLLAKLPAAVRRFRLLNAVAEISARVLRRISTPRGFAAFFGYSLAINFFNVLLFYFIGQALHVELRFVDCLVLLPPVFFIAMLPISVSGWGVREGATIMALGIAGVPSSAALAVSVSFGVGLIVISLPGGLLWLFDRRSHVHRHAPADAQNQVQRADSQP